MLFYPCVHVCVRMFTEASETNDIWNPKKRAQQIYAAKHAEYQPQATQDEEAVQAGLLLCVEFPYQTGS